MPRRILLLITDLEIGGTPTVVRELATRLNDPAGAVEVEVACLSKWGPVADQLRDAGVRVTAFSARGPRDFLSARRQLVELVRERQVDTVFSFLIHANAVAAAASRKLPGVRFLQSIQTVQPKPRWHWWLQRRIHRYADKIVGPSTAVADVARQRCGVPPEKFVVIPNAIDPNAFPRVQVFQEPARIRVGFLGRLDPVKQVPYWVKSLWIAERDDVRVEGHIFGDGADRPAVEQAIASLGVGDRVFLHGAVPDPRIALAQMDVLYLTSIGEGFGLVLIEAMASGVPVIALSAGGVADIVRNRENGLLLECEQDSYRQFPLRLEKLHNEPDFRRHLIENALRSIGEKFTWSAVLPQYCRLLRLP
jgi:glycosyltransferase involved in cell wall biosynthesis